MKTVMRFSVSLFLYLAILNANAQIDGGVDIVHEIELDLPEATRNFEKIKTEIITSPSKVEPYTLQEVDLNLPYLPTKMKPAKMPPDALKKLYGNNFKIGAGNYGTSYAEVYLNSKRSDKGYYGARLRHFASQAGPVERNLSRSSENLVSLFGKYYLDGVTLKGDINYTRFRHNFYGARQDTLEHLSDITQVFNIFNVQAGVESTNKNADFVYDLNFNYFNFSDRFKAKESEYLTDINAAYKLNNEARIDVGAVLSFSTRKDSNSTDRTFFLIKPGYSLNKGRLRGRAGINVAYTNDTVYNSGVHLYPNVRVEYDVIERTVVAFASLEGEMQKNTLRQFAMQNPWIDSNVVLAHTNKPLELMFGAKGNLIEKLNYKARLAYQTFKNLHFFNNAATDTSRFEILYDNGTSTVLNFGANLSYDVTNKFLVELRADYYSYTLSKIEKPWHRPDFSSSILTRYKLDEKIIINAEFYYISGLMGKNPVSGKVTKLDPITDLNLRAEYRFSPAFSAYLQLNNIFAKKYQHYLYYPVKGINVLAGLTYQF